MRIYEKKDRKAMFDVSKKQLRISIRDEITAMSDEYVTSSNNGIFNNVKALNEFVNAKNIMFYYSIKREPETHELAKLALEMGKIVAYPRFYREGVMHAHIIKCLSEITSEMLGIPIPSITAPMLPHNKLDMVIVPALTYDRSGYRLGYGGGYYDRFLCSIPAVTVGLARSCLLKNALPVESHDIPVMFVATEDDILTTVP